MADNFANFKTVAALFVALLCVTGIIRASENNGVRSILIADQPTGMTISEKSESGVTLDVRIGRLDLVPVMIKGRSFVLARADALTRSHKIGEPNLPTANRLLAIPEGATLSARVIDFEAEEIALADFGLDDPLMPVQPSLSKSASPEDIPLEFNDAVYETDRFYSLAPVSAEFLGIMRSVRVGRVIVAPIQYNPVKNRLRVYRRMTIRVDFQNADWPATRLAREKGYSPFFEPIYDQITGLEKVASVQDDITRYPVKYAIVADRAFEAQLQPFIEWKTRKGFIVDTAYTDVIGYTRSEIKTYLENLYFSGTPGDPAPTFVLLVGDDQQIPAYYTDGHKTDMYYCEYSDDYFPEAYYGRFSAQNMADLQPQIDKTLEYERYEMPDPSYLAEVTLVSGVDLTNALTYGNGQINYGTTQYFNLAHGISPNVWLYPDSDEDGIADSVIETINDGVGFINYTAHCGHLGWSNPAFYTSHILNELTNIHKYLFSIGNCCQTNTFGKEFTSPCFGEVWMRAEDRGGIGHIGGTADTYWDEDYWWAVGYGPLIGSGPSYEQTGLGAFDGAFHDHGEPVSQHYVTNGAMVFAGNLAVTEAGSYRTQYYWEVYTLMGDPSVMTFWGVPVANNISHTEYASVLDNVISVTADPGSYVGISMNGVRHGQAHIDETGAAEIEIIPFGESGTADVVVTAQNKIPYMGNIVVSPTVDPFLVQDGYQIDDQTGGNGNAQLEPGESVILGMQIKNIGGGPAYNVEATLSTTDPNISITDNHEFFGDIQPNNGTVNLDDAFALESASGMPDGYEIQFTLTMTDDLQNEWVDEFDLTVHAPELSPALVEVNDAAGDNDGFADPGETFELILTLDNDGSGQVDNLTGFLSEDDELVSIDDGYSQFGTIPSGSEGTNAINPFVLSISPDCPLGHEIHLNLLLEADFGFTDTLQFILLAGQRFEFHYDDFSFDQGWSDLGGPGEWTIGPAGGGLGNDGVGSPDPAEDRSPGEDNKILGNDLGSGRAGDYSPGLSTTYYVTSPTIDCSGFNRVVFSFYRWLGIQAQDIDLADIQVFDGLEWSAVFQTGGEVIDDGEWLFREYDVSSAADNNPDFKIRFGIGRTNSYSNYCGWNIDDLSLSGFGSRKSGIISLDVNPLRDSLISDEVVEDTLTISNQSETDTLYIQFNLPTDIWLSCPTDPIYIAPLENHKLPVLIDATDMDPGNHVGVLSYASNDYRHKLGGVEVHLYIYAPEIEVPAASIVKTISSGGTGEKGLAINNQGPGLLEFEATTELFTGTEADWLAIAPTNGEIPPAGTDSIMVGFNAELLSNGEYYGQVRISSNDPLTPQQLVPVILKVIICGDANGDGNVNISDVVYLTSYIFHGGSVPDPIESGDANGDGSVNVADAVYLLNLIFNGGPAPICP